MVRQDGTRAGLFDWPASIGFFLLGVAVLYAPTLAATEQEWVKNDNYAHGFFIFPVSIFLLWMAKDKIRDARPKPEAWGLLLLALALIIEMGSYLLQIKYIGMWSLVPALAGGVLALHGKALWKIVQFPVLFLLFAAPFSNTVLGHITTIIQSLSTIGASELMSLIGYPVLRHGNVLQVPGATLEVATACSGFHKLVSLLAFSSIYGHLFLSSPAKRAFLLVMAIPIALLVNVLRISSLVAASIYGGLPALHATHDPAEFVAIGIAFVLFVLLGKKLGS